MIATTIALVAVFTPLAFLKGATGRLFNEFGIAVAGSVIISGFVALTLTPMLCAKILRVPPAARRALPRAGERASTASPRATPARCGCALRHRLRRGGCWRPLVTLGACCVFRVAQAGVRARRRTAGFFFTFIIAPEGSTLAYTDEYQRQVEAILRQDQGRRAATSAW